MKILTKKPITTISKLVLLIVLFLSESLFSQTTVFIKYKDELSLDAVNRKIGEVKSSYAVDKSLRFDSFSALVERATGTGADRLKRIRKIELTDKASADNLIANLANDNDVEYVQEALRYKIDYMPNDSLLTDQWALENINAFDAWEITDGSDEIVIGVIDTGIDFFHPDLRNKLYINPLEDINNNGFYDEGDNDGIDNDGNGFVDDVFGWDFTDRNGFPFDSSGGDYLNWDNYPLDEHGHGTYVSGIIGAQVNNISGIAGVMPKGRIMNLRAFDPSGYGEEDDVAAAVLYAVEAGVDVLNMSFGDNAFSYILKDVVEYAYSQGVVMIASSGNSGSSAPHYPSGYSQVICVGSSTQNNYVYGGSNYGSTLDLVAPGLNILTTSLNGEYTNISGTSAAAPFVSAAAGLLLSMDDFSPDEIRQILKSTSLDILEEGWDEKSGAGKLDLLKALQVAAPSVIKFNHPLQDFATMEESININATILSASFQSYSLSYGTGDNPDSWTDLKSDITYQTKNEDIYSFDISGLKDSTYTLRIEVTLLSGRTLEERVNFHIDHTPPVLTNISLGPTYYGEKPTISGAFMTDEYSVVKMYYREVGQTEYRFVTLDGFATNNQFFKELHYGFIPKGQVSFNTTYEVYFEAENLVGLSTVYNNEGANFFIETHDFYFPSSFKEMSYKLPVGDIFDQTADLTGNGRINILSNEYPSSENLDIYDFDGSGFTKISTVEGRRPITLDDFNNDGKYELFSNFARDPFLQTQKSFNIAEFDSVNLIDTSKMTLWPILAEDIDGDGRTELVGVEDETTITIKEVSNQLVVSDEAELIIPDEDGFFGNYFINNTGVIADANNNGNKELWVVDSDADVICYEATGRNTYANIAQISSGLYGNRAKITTGDYNGDGVDEIAVLLQTNSDVHIAPLYFYYVFNIVGDELNVIAQNAIVNPSNEFTSTTFRDVRGSIRLEDINNDGKDELFVFAFPYAYIFDYDNGNNKVIFFEDGVNTNRILIEDLDGNGFPEFTVPYDDGIKFYELEGAQRASMPSLLNAYSINGSSVYLNWNVSSESLVNIYRGTTTDNLIMIASGITGNEFTDNSDLSNEENYYYALQADNPVFPENLSRLTAVKEVYVHNPAKPISVIAETNKHILVRFDEKINKTIDNLESIYIEGVPRPNSISAADEYSYLLTLKESLAQDTYTLVIHNLKDNYGSPVQDAVLFFDVRDDEVSEDFYITSFNVINSKKISVEFNKKYGESVFNTSNYLVSPDYNQVTNVTSSTENPNLVIIDFEHPVTNVGKDFKIELKNIYSEIENIKISEGAGSVIVISSFEKTLDDVFVYPNPSNGASKITFANLTKRVKIIIFTINGVKVTEINEYDGNGGLEWNLTDDSGSKVSSGIYVYKIIAYDESENEIENKIGKFAIIQ